MQQNLFTEGEMTTSRPTITKPNVSLSTFYHGDCLIEMDKIADKSVDAIICDLPYGTTACKWDSVIPFEPLWKQYERIIKDNGAIVLFANEPFATVLRNSNFKKYRYDWIWNKKFAGSFGIAKFQPMRIHENICVFYKKTPLYNPQMVKRDKPITNGGNKCLSDSGQLRVRQEGYKKVYDEQYPQTILEYSGRHKDRGLHPTVKPLDLIEYLVLTYTNECETVLDNCMGSGTTGVACKKTGRHFIGIEKDEKYFEIAVSRVSDFW